MWTSEMKRIFQAGALVLAFGLSGIALAQPPAEAPAAAGRQGLRQTIEKRYEVLPIRNGVVLTPRQERLGVQTIEVSGDTIAVNGEKVSEGVVRAWLAEDADLILRLHRLPPQERQALFGLRTGGGAAPEEDTGDAEVAETDVTEEGAGEDAGDEVGETDIPAEGEVEGEVPGVPGAPEPPEPPDAPEEDESPRVTTETSGSRVKFGGSITIQKDERAEEAVAILGSVRVDGEVSRQVTAVGGSVTINGLVGGEVTAVGGNVRLGPDAVVDGDVSSVGGTVIRAEGAKVHGKISEVGMVPPDGNWENDLQFRPWSPFISNSLDLVWQLVSLVVLALLVFLCILLARRSMERAEHYVATEPWRAALVGFLAQLFFLPLLGVVTILLAITVVGCALFLLYPFLFIAIMLAALLGYAAVAHRLGRVLEARFGWNLGPAPYAAALMGVLALQIWSLFGRVLGMGSGFLDLIAVSVLAFSFLVQYAAWTVGFGAVLLARFDNSPGRYQPALSPMPPAPPPSPVFATSPAPLPELSPDFDEPSAPERPWDPVVPPEPER